LHNPIPSITTASITAEYHLLYTARMEKHFPAGFELFLVHCHSSILSGELFHLVDNLKTFILQALQFRLLLGNIKYLVFGFLKILDDPILKGFKK
jgi:hypothetical protein